MTLTRIPKLVLATIAIATLGLGALALAQHGAGHRGHFGRGGFGPDGFGRGAGAFLPLRQLDLTDAQREQIRGIFDQHKSDFAAIGERMGAARKAQRDAIRALPSDESLIRTRTTELAAVEADAAVLRARVHNAVFGVLTPEQQEKAKTLQADREKRGAEMRQRWQERRQERQQQRQQENKQNPQQPAPPVER